MPLRLRYRQQPYDRLAIEPGNSARDRCARLYQAAVYGGDVPLGRCRYRGRTGSLFDLAFSHNFCSRDVAWFHPAYVWTKRGDVGTTSPTVLVRLEPLPEQPRYRLASLQHHPLIIAQAWGGCSCALQGPGQSEWGTGQFKDFCWPLTCPRSMNTDSQAAYRRSPHPFTPRSEQCRHDRSFGLSGGQ